MRPTWQRAVEEAALCGFSHAVLVPARRYTAYRPNAEALRQRIGDDPVALLDGARSVLVAAMPYAWFSAWPEGYAAVSAFYFQSQHAHRAVRRLGERLCALGARVSDDQRLPAKLLGQTAGLGRLGRNSLLHNDAWGSCFTLRILTTDIDPPDDAEAIVRMPAGGCDNCRRCVDACPTGALDGAGNVDTARCIRTHMLAGTVVPAGLRRAMGARLLGCELCQRACPHNAKVPQAMPDAAPFDIAALLRGARRDLDAVAARIGWNEARLQRIQAQASLAAGNAGDMRHVPLLQALCTHENPAVREHATWALEQYQRSDDHAEA